MLIPDENIARAEQIMGHVFADKLLCAEAIQMAAPRAMVVVSNKFQTVDKNNRMAVLGDSVLSKVLCGMWFRAHDSAGTTQSSLHLSTSGFF
jgi:ribonuclease-3